MYMLKTNEYSFVASNNHSTYPLRILAFSRVMFQPLKVNTFLSYI